MEVLALKQYSLVQSAGSLTSEIESLAELSQTIIKKNNYEYCNGRIITCYGGFEYEWAGWLCILKGPAVLVLGLDTDRFGSNHLTTLSTMNRLESSLLAINSHSEAKPYL